MHLGFFFAKNCSNVAGLCIVSFIRPSGCFLEFGVVEIIIDRLVEIIIDRGKSTGLAWSHGPQDL